jgi:transcriptional regulator with XRE-family HTH domain
MRLVRLLRERRGWSQEQFADALGAAGARILRTSIGNMETGRACVSLAQAAAMASVLDVSLDALVVGIQCERCKGFPPVGFSCNDCGASAPAAKEA